jgi:DNA-binding transcriptional regulator LsrR (DeoR family)
MKKTRFDIQEMVQVSRMYYVEGLTQDTIAKELDFSRSLISMILAEAREHGIVQIIVKDPSENNIELARYFEEQYGLENCLVVPTSVTSTRLLIKIIAAQGAALAESKMESHTTVGIAWGMTCFEFMQSFKNEKDICDINVVPLIGGSNRATSEYQLNEIVRMFAEKLNGAPSFIYAPALAESIEDHDLYMKSAYMRSIADKWRYLNMAIISAGATPEYYSSSIQFEPKVMIDILKTDPEKAVGDFCARRYNINGAFLDNDYNKRVMGIGEESLRNAEKVMCVAAGNHKIFSIIGALRSGLLNYLVLDENMAISVKEILEAHII